MKRDKYNMKQLPKVIECSTAYQTKVYKTKVYQSKVYKTKIYKT